MRLRLTLLMLAVATMMLPGDSRAWGRPTRTSDGTTHRARADARVTGTVFDSIGRVPLAGAVVQLVGRSDRSRTATTRTDGDGRFAFESVAPGGYVAGFLHPRLDSLYITAPVREVDVPATGAVQLRLFVPSRPAILRAHCGPSAATDSSGIFLGRVRPASDGAPTRATLTVKWVELTIANGIRRQMSSVEAQTDPSGAFAICGLPSDTRLLVQAWSARDTSGLVELDMPPQGLLLRDLHVGTFQSVSVASPVSADTSAAGFAAGIADSVVVLRGTGRLRGTVRGESASPVSGATVRLRGSESSATTDASGSFSLSSLPTGTHALEAVAIGFQPARVVVDIVDADSPPADITLRAAGPVLDTMRVFGTRDNVSAPWRSHFDTRRKLGLGRFLDEAAIEKRDPMTMTDLLSSMPGVAIRAGRFSSRSTLMVRSSKGGYCIPTYIIDGVPTDVGDGGLDSFVSARHVRAVELYRSPNTTPLEFAQRGECGMIVIWTGMRER